MKWNNIIKSRRSLISLGIIIGSLGTIYMVGGLFFTSHFYWGTSINDTNVGGKSLKVAEAKLEEMSSIYTLELRERHEKQKHLQEVILA